MEFKEAAAYVIPFGKYIGKSLDAIAETDEGLKYLDYMSGQKITSARCREAFDVYLSDPSIQKELGNLR